MNAKEKYELRLEMAKMQDQFIQRMSEAYDREYYIETVWYCYAIFEHRINRFISKYIDKCTIAPERTDDKTVSISTRISCLKKVIRAKYNALSAPAPNAPKHSTRHASSSPASTKRTFCKPSTSPLR